MHKFGKYFICFFMLFTAYAAAQSMKNQDVFCSLIDSSIALLPDDIPENSNFTIYTGNNAFIYNYVFKKLKQVYTAGISDSTTGISYVLEDIRLSYGDIFRKKFLGDYYLERNFYIRGNFVVPASGESRDFNYTYRDSVKLEEVRDLENPNLPFTRGEIPSEPFLEGLPEPVIAVGTAAAAVILFFVLRSK